MAETIVTIPCARFNLEGSLGLPDRLSGAVPGVVVCHPHPLYGGDMGNSVVIAVCGALLDRGIATLRFNFRGAGGSGGSFDGGIGERDDARAALAFLAEREEVDPERIGLAGYSFGATVAASVAAGDPRVKALVAVSLPTSNLAALSLARCHAPKLFVVGDGDPYASAPDLQRLAESALPAEVRVVEGADHFWQGDEWEMARDVALFFDKAFPLPEG